MPERPSARAVSVAPLALRAAMRLTLAGTMLGAAGCTSLGMLVGGMAESARRTGTSDIQAEYTGLQGKSFAVVVAADRATQADFPDVVARVTLEVSKRLAASAGASGYVPGERVLQWQYNNPRWATMPMSELAGHLGVQRLVYIDLIEYRLNDPGNAYLWDGLATANVGVVEADTPLADDFAMQKQVSVRFPDNEGSGPADIPFAAVNTELSRRLTERAAWLFFDHEEKNELEY